MKPFTREDCEIIESRILYEGVFRLINYRLRHKLFEGGWSEIFSREVLQRASAAAVLPYDPLLDKVILIEQFRPGILDHHASPWLLEIPAGIIVDDRTPLEVAKAEAFEEAGCQVEQLIPICDYYVSPGGSNEHLSLFIGKVDANNAEGIFGLPHEHENIRVHALDFKQAWHMLPQIKTSPALIALFWLNIHKQDVKTLRNAAF